MLLPLESPIFTPTWQGVGWDLCQAGLQAGSGVVQDARARPGSKGVMLGDELSGTQEQLGLEEMQGHHAWGC